MTIMVDELKGHPRRADTAQGRRWFGGGKESCHLTFTAPSTVDDLHAFAARLGLKREWFQPHWSAPHYDLIPTKRARAIALGAVFVSAREQAIARVAARARAAGGGPDGPDGTGEERGG